MKHNTYPVIMNLGDKNVVVVGGGNVAEKKIEKLLDTGAKLVVISPEVTSKLQKWASEQRFVWKEKTFEREDIAHAQFVIAATNQREVNQSVYQSVSEMQWICIVDDPERSSFTVPSTVRRGKMTVSVSTSGASPGLAKKIARDLAGQYDESYEAYVDFLYQCRQRVQREVQDPNERRRILKALLEPEFLELTRANSMDKREQRFLSLFPKESV